MLRLSLQFFAHKKGVGSTKNGRDSESKRLGVKKADGQAVIAGSYALTVSLFNAKTLRLTVTTVLGRTNALFVCKKLQAEL